MDAKWSVTLPPGTSTLEKTSGKARRQRKPGQWYFLQ